MSEPQVQESEFEKALGQVLENAMHGIPSKLFPNGLTISDEPQHQPLYTCHVCRDQGIVTIELPRSERLYGHNAGMMSLAARCMCEIGRGKNTATPIRDLCEFWSEAQLAACFPRGAVTPTYRIERRMTDAGFLPVMQGWTIATYKAQIMPQRPNLRRFVSFADAWIQTDPQARIDLVLYGPPGTGKTGLAVGMARACLEQGQTVRFTTARDLMLEWRTAARGETSTELELLARYKAIDVLVIDELGGTKLTEFVGDTLLALIDHRQKSRRPTLFTFNAPAELSNQESRQIMKDLFGPALYDRLIENGQPWYLDGASLRKNRTTKA